MNEDIKLTNLKLSNEESNKFTRECLRTALFRLIAQKDFNEISVSEIVKEAGVSRNSFYRNFGSMDSLLKDLRGDMIKQLSDFFLSYETYDDRQDWYRDLFSKVKEKRREFSILLDIKIPMNFFAEDIDFGNIIPVKISNRNYENLAAAGSFLIILYHWFTSGMKESPDEMAGICVKILPDIKID